MSQHSMIDAMTATTDALQVSRADLFDALEWLRSEVYPGIVGHPLDNEGIAAWICDGYVLKCRAMGLSHQEAKDEVFRHIEAVVRGTPEPPWPDANPEPQPEPEPPEPEPEPAPLARLVAQGTHFSRAGQAYPYHGASAFSAVFLVANGREDEAWQYFSWLAERAEFARIFTTAKLMFDLPAAEGLAYLPDTLTLAARAGLYCEVVACADTAGWTPAQIRAHLAGVDAICDQHPNALLELANEPLNITQSPDLPAIIKAYRPVTRPYCIGAADGPNDGDTQFDGGDYINVHSDRSTAERWREVRHTKEVGDKARAQRKPANDDEGFKDTSDPEKWRARAVLCQMQGIGHTIHLESGKSCRIPTGAELQCFNAAVEGWALVPRCEPSSYRNARAAYSPVKDASLVDEDHPDGAAVRVYASVPEWVQALGVIRDPAVEWREGWQVVSKRAFPGWILWQIRQP
jgi:hypothetical protein